MTIGRPATGAPRWNASQGYWEARVSLGDKREPVPMRGIPKCSATPPSSSPASCSCASCAQACRVARMISDKTRAEGRVLANVEETANEWHTRYLTRHEELGRTTRNMAGAWERWVGPTIGTIAMADVKRDHIITIRNALTKAVEADEITAKRALNIWSEIVKAPFGRAFHDDDPQYSTLRVGSEATNPAVGVKPPVTKAQLVADRRERQPLYPYEFFQLITCAEIPVEDRRSIVIATYLYSRPQEHFANRWFDVDWRAREVRVRRKLDVRSGNELPGTKSDAGIREIPIHENLMPLLEAMHAIVGDDNDRLIPPPGGICRRGNEARSYEKLAKRIRAYLKIAGIARRELWTGTPDHMPFDWRSLRTTGCTWMAMLGTDSYVLARYSGHKQPETTWASYIKQGPDLRRRHGEPFPPLPADLLDVPPPEPRPTFGRVLVSGQNRLNDPATLQRRGRDSKLPGGGPKTASAEALAIAGRSPGEPENTEAIGASASPLAIAAEPTPAATVLDGSERPESAREDPRELLRRAIMLHLERGEDSAAAELMEILKRKPAPVLALQRPR